MVHRKKNHQATVAVCRKFTEGACNFTSESCWWNHFEKENINGRIQCFMCDETFESKSEMMRHRKNQHSSIVQRCNLFLKKSCRFQSEFCWFKHDIENTNDDHESNEDAFKDNKETINEPNEPSVFQKAMKNPDPPSDSKNETKTQQ